MGGIDDALNTIYCSSRKACSIMRDLKVYQPIAKNYHDDSLYILLEELQVKTLEVFNAIQKYLPGEHLRGYLTEVAAKGPSIEKAFRIFITAVPLQLNHVLVVKLRLQINNILLILKNLEENPAKR